MTLKKPYNSFSTRLVLFKFGSVRDISYTQTYLKVSDDVAQINYTNLI